jgi:hypothetical protein
VGEWLSISQNELAADYHLRKTFNTMALKFLEGFNGNSFVF